MNAIIVHSVSKHKHSKSKVTLYDGDLYEITPKKPIKNIVLQMIVYGFKTVAKRKVSYNHLDIDFSQYDEITLISPVWAGQVNAFMRQFLTDHQIVDKDIRIVGTSKGGYDKYFQSFGPYIDDSNTIIEETMFVNGKKVSEDQ